MSKQKRLVLHVGQTKAGSTAIQNYLDIQRNALAERGFLVPELASSRLNPFSTERTAGHLSLVRKLLSDQEIDSAPFAELQSSPNLVLSAENLFLDRPDSELKALANLFSSHTITLVVVVRSAESWLLSRYVENVMSGFKSSTSTFSNFCEQIVSHKAHDYAARLDHVVALLKPAHVRLIYYDAENFGNGIVPAFLAASGLPVTDKNLACSIRANVREDLGFLIESKRRLNYLAQALPLPARLEVEMRVREQAQSISAASPSSMRPWDLNAVLPVRACQEIAVSNRRLVEDFGLCPPLRDLQPRPAMQYQHRRSWQGADKLTTFGLMTIARLVKNEAQTSKKQLPWPLLSVEGSELAIDLLASSRVTLHLESPETALWAACYSGRLPVLLAEGTAWSDHDRFLKMKLPSDILCVRETATWRSVVGPHFPEVVVVPPTASLDKLAACWQGAEEDAALIFLGRDVDIIARVTERLDLVCRAAAGKTYVFSQSKLSKLGISR